MANSVLIIHGDSQFGFMDNVAEEVAGGFRALGMHAAVMHLLDEARVDKVGRLMHTVGIDLFLMMNGVGLDPENAGLLGFLDSLGVPVVAFFVDHPMYHAQRIAAPVRRLHVTIPNPHDADFIRRFIRDDIPIRHVAHGAGRPLPGLARPWAERDIDVLVPSSLSVLPEAERAAWPAKHGGIVAAQLNAIVAVHEAAPARPLHEAIQEVMGERAATIPQLFPYFLTVDGYLRSRAKLDSVRALVERGVAVTVCGPGWPELGGTLTLTGSVPLAEAFALMGRSRLVMNHLPAYYESHERPLQAALYGAAAVSTPSPWLDRVMAGEAVALPASAGDGAAVVAAALHDPDLPERAARGRRAVENGQMWAHRAAEVARFAGLPADTGGGRP